jgi:Phage minor capsid protein 2
VSIRKIPEPTYDKDSKKIIKMYDKARQAIILELLKLVETGSDNKVKINQQASMLRQVDFILSQLNANVQATLEEGLLASFTEGQAVLSYSVGDYKSLKEATENVAFSMLAQETIDTIMQDTFDDLLSATQLTSKRTKQIVRRVVSEKMKIDMARAKGYDVMKSSVIEELTKSGLSKTVTKDGFVGIIDKAGRKWKMSNYVDMVVKTKYKQARFEGLRTKALEDDIDLAIISSHGAKDACRKYEGMIISMNGTTKGYPSYSELRKSNEIFHPRCKHTIYPFRSPDLLSGDERQKSEEQIKNYRK